MTWASRALTRRDNRLDVLALIAARGQEVFFAKELAAILGINPNQVTPELDLLRDLGAVVALEGSERQNYHQALSHPIWAFAAGMVARTVATRYPDAPELALKAYLQDRYRLSTRSPLFTLEASSAGSGPLRADAPRTE